MQLHHTKTILETDSDIELGNRLTEHSLTLRDATGQRLAIVGFDIFNIDAVIAEYGVQRELMEHILDLHQGIQSVGTPFFNRRNWKIKRRFTNKNTSNFTIIYNFVNYFDISADMLKKTLQKIEKEAQVFGGIVALDVAKDYNNPCEMEKEEYIEFLKFLGYKHFSTADFDLNPLDIMYKTV